MRYCSTDKYRGPAAGRAPRALFGLLARWPCQANRWPLGSARSSSAAGERGADLCAQNPLRRVEAVLFLAREPISSRKLSSYANLADGTEARTLIRRLNEDYDRSGRAFRVEEVGGGFQLLTRAQFAPWLRRLEHAPAETRLSTPAMETLAVVAYRQPVLRAEIEAIRGVGCGEVLRQLMERDMVRISGRSDELGRPYLYGTTQRFLQVFGLRSADDLPRAAALHQFASPPNNSTSRNVPIDGNVEELEVSVTAPDEILNEERLARPVSVLPISESLESDDWEDEDDLEDEDDEDDDDAEGDDFDDDEEDEEFDEEFDDEDFEDDDDWEEVEDDDEEEDDDDDWEDDFDDDDDDEELDDEEEEDEAWEA